MKCRRLHAIFLSPDLRAEAEELDLEDGAPSEACNDEGDEPKSPGQSGWFAKRDASPTRAVVEESDLIAVETSKARRYSFVAARAGKKLRQG